MGLIRIILLGAFEMDCTRKASAKRTQKM